MNELVENQYYLLRRRQWPETRIARFNGFGSNKGWAGMDWAGDSGHSTDSWMHDEVIWYVKLDDLVMQYDQATKEVNSVILKKY